MTSTETVLSILTYRQNGTHLLPNILRLMQIYLLVPLTTASAERSCSVQRSLKTYLRRTITEKRYDNLLMFNMHKPRTDSICLKINAKIFVRKNEHRLRFFGKFDDDNGVATCVRVYM